MLPHTSGRIQIDPDAGATEASPELVLQPDPDFLQSSREPVWDTGSTSALRVVAVMQAAAERGIEHIELSSTDTAARALTDTDSQPIEPGGTALIERLIELEQHNRTLAADLAELRAQLEARDIEHATEIAVRDGEISRLSDEVMSVTLERDGLKARWREAEQVRGGSGHNAAPAAPAAAVDVQQVERLKERLAERAHAIAAAREEIDILNSERRRLMEQVAALSRQLGQPAGVLQAPATDTENEPRSPVPGLRAVVRRLSRSLSWRSAASAATGPSTAQSLPAQKTAVPPPSRATPPQEPAPARAAGLPAPAIVRQGTPVAPAVPAADHARRGRLVMLEGGTGATFELTGEIVSVGRGQKADISLADPSVSRLHAMLRHGDAGVLVEDLASANGVFVNGQAVRLHLLHDGDELAFGNVRFTYRASP